MPRTDENGRQLKALLDYLLGGDVEAKAIYDALGISSSTYYRRIKEHTYPDAEELRRVADRFALRLSGPSDQVRADEPSGGVALRRVGPVHRDSGCRRCAHDTTQAETVGIGAAS